MVPPPGTKAEKIPEVSVALALSSPAARARVALIQAARPRSLNNPELKISIRELCGWNIDRLSSEIRRQF